MRLHQLNTLRIIKLEYEMMVLKNMVYKNLSKLFEADFKEIETKHESFTKMALLANLDSIRAKLNYLDEDVIKQLLELDDRG